MYISNVNKICLKTTRTNQCTKKGNHPLAYLENKFRAVQSVSLVNVGQPVKCKMFIYIKHTSLKDINFNV